MGWGSLLSLVWHSDLKWDTIYRVIVNDWVIRSLSFNVPNFQNVIVRRISNTTRMLFKMKSVRENGLRAPHQVVHYFVFTRSSKSKYTSHLKSMASSSPAPNRFFDLISHLGGPAIATADDEWTPASRALVDWLAAQIDVTGAREGSFTTAVDRTPATDDILHACLARVTLEDDEVRLCVASFARTTGSAR